MFDFSGLLGGLDPSMLAMGGGMPDLMNPAGAVTSPPLQGNPLMGIDNVAAFGLPAGLDPSALAGPMLANGNPISSGMGAEQMSGLLGLAGAGRQNAPSMPRAPGGGLAMGQMGQMQMMPGARLLRR